MESSGQGGGFLPPEPRGPEPDLGETPRADHPAPQPQQQPAWGWQQQPPEPDNGAAVAGFVTSVVSGALLLMSFGFLGLITAIAAPFGIHYSRKGKRAVAEGRTRKHAGLAQAGFVIGIVTLVLSLLAVAVGIALIVAIATDEEFRRDLENDGGGFDSTSATVMLAVVGTAVRLVG